MTTKFLDGDDLERALRAVEGVAHSAASREEMQEALERLDDIEASAPGLDVDPSVRVASARDWLQTRLASHE